MRFESDEDHRRMIAASSLSGKTQPIFPQSSQIGTNNSAAQQAGSRFLGLKRRPSTTNKLQRLHVELKVRFST
jgi:hypothetical protein